MRRPGLMSRYLGLAAIGDMMLSAPTAYHERPERKFSKTPLSAVQQKRRSKNKRSRRARRQQRKNRR